MGCITSLPTLPAEVPSIKKIMEEVKVIQEEIAEKKEIMEAKIEETKQVVAEIMQEVESEKSELELRLPKVLPEMLEHEIPIPPMPIIKREDDLYAKMKNYLLKFDLD